ncbi:hypothetical protein [Helcococcus ovis]|uniref:hypothetical protein n=1 Tax=Helcococcus ovis TaxID=72026 RepID=UPI0038BE072E
MIARGIYDIKKITFKDLDEIFKAIGALFIIDGKMSIGDLLVFQSISQYFTEPVQNLVGLQLTFQESSIAINRLNELMAIHKNYFKMVRIQNYKINETHKESIVENYSEIITYL